MTSEECVLDVNIEEVSKKLKQIVMGVLNLNLPMDAVTDTTSLYDMGLESLNVVDVLTEVESEFDIVVDAEDLSPELFIEFQNLVKYVVGKL